MAGARQARRDDPEAREQKALAEWLDYAVGVMGWCHVPNESRAHVSWRTKLKAMGVKSGVPDVLVFKALPCSCDCATICHDDCTSRVRGVAIELKAPGRTQPSATSANQRAWHEALRDNGWICEVIDGADNAIKFLETLGYNK